MDKNSLQCIQRITGLGVSLDDALALRRISMTLQRWFEQECGDGNNYGSWCITRGRKRKFIAEDGTVTRTFERDDDGKPYMEHHHYSHAAKDSVTYSPLPDRETGARKRLAKIVAKYAPLSAYVQTDPRGCAVYLLQPGDVPAGEDVSAYYSRGVAVHK